MRRYGNNRNRQYLEAVILMISSNIASIMAGILEMPRKEMRNWHGECAKGREG